MAGCNQKVLDAVLNELQRAKSLFPEWPRDVYQQLAILGEEYGELQKAVLHCTYEGGLYNDVIGEAIQTAAMALRFLENLDYSIV